MNEDRIEELLRRAPAASPPPQLLGRLLDDISLPGEPRVIRRAPEGIAWFRAWLPNLGFAGGLLVCAALLAYQGNRLADLREKNRQLDTVSAELDTLRREAESRARFQPDAEEEARLQRDRQELAQLRAEVARLQAALAAATANHPQKSATVGTAAAAGVTPETDEEFFARIGDPRTRAQSITCINNLKQIGLAARIYANDNGDVFPPSWLAMTNELVTPKVLVCPADRARPVAPDWASFSPANVSYNLLNAGGDEANPHVVLAQCPVHLHVCLSDGSVQNGEAFGKSFTLSTQGGKTVFQPAQQKATQATMDEIMRQRYGLEPKPSSEEILRQRYGLPAAKP